MQTNNQEFQTYTDNRKCLNCSVAIPDQEHASTKFCGRKVLPDGSIKACKDDYHSAKNKEKNIPYLSLSRFHKETSDKIEKLLLTKGENVKIEDITYFQIRLDMPVKIEMRKDRLLTFHFIDFSLVQQTQSNFKISKHENKF